MNVDIQTWYEADGTVVMSADGAELHMSRGEAESLFVMLGHTLQDMDTMMDNYSEDKGKQPDG